MKISRQQIVAYVSALKPGGTSEFTSSRLGDSPLLPDLLAQIPPEETIGTVTADGAYDTHRCHGAIIDRGAEAV